MNHATSNTRPWLRLIALGSLVLLAACERPPMETKQQGYRGTGMVQIVNPRLQGDVAAANQIPVSIPPASAEGPKAGQVYQNVKVLGDLSVGEFTRLMVNMTAWVSPEQGCNYCHNPANLADDSLYTKVVARRMVQMTQHINTDWKPHVAETGVTCYTCHRGQPVPSNVWFTADAQPYGSNFMGDKAGQNSPTVDVKLGSLPYDPLNGYLAGTPQAIRVGGTTALPTGKGASIQQTEKTYALMTHMSSALGQNCTFCHNTQNFSKWEGTPPQRVTAWHGIQMTRDLNLAYMEPLTSVFPANRKGELGDVAKANCATCHQGVNKPLAGVPMLKDHPELAAYRPYTAPAPAAPAPTTAPGPSQ
jgi:photosynthetic reaction center cytochrome c subunit